MDNLTASTRFKLMQVQGKEVVFLDYSSATRDECLAVTAEFDRWLETQEQKKQVRVMMDTRGAFYDPRHVNHWRASVSRYEKYFFKSGMVSDSALFKLIIASIRAYARVIGRPMRPTRGQIFDSIEKGMEWVIQD